MNKDKKYDITVTHTFCVCFVFAAVVVTADDLNLDKWTCNAAANFYQVSRTQHLNITPMTLVHSVAQATKLHSNAHRKKRILVRKKQE